MKRLMMACVLAGGAFSGSAFADIPGADWISQEKVRDILSQQGYRMTKVEADDGHWEGEATRDGAKYDFHVDAHSGKVTKMELDKD